MVTLDETPSNEKDIDFEDKLWKAADKLRKKVEVHEYKYVVLGLIFLRHLSFAFDVRRKELEEMFSNPKSNEYKPSGFRKEALEDKDYYLGEGILYVPEKGRWDFLVKNATQPRIGEIIDSAVEVLEREYPKQLKDVIPKIYTSINLDPLDFAYLINLFTSIQFQLKDGKDVFGRIYEYFLGKFAEAEGKKGGEFYTPRSLTKLIIEILDVKPGKIFDPACGSGGFFVAALEKMERQGKDKSELTIYGQESKPMPWKLSKMNLALRNAEGDVRIGDSYHDDKFPNLQADFVVSNPPFNNSGWGADRIRFDDPRFKDYGVPSDNNANYAWILHFLSHISPNGRAGFVMANGALSGGNSEGELRRKLIENDLVWGVVACPPKLFYNVGLSVSLWFLRKSKPSHMKKKFLFVYAKKTFNQISRRQVVLAKEQSSAISNKFKLFESDGHEDDINEDGFSRVAGLAEVIKNRYVLTPGRYVGIKAEEDEFTFDEKMKAYSPELSRLINEERVITARLNEIMEELGYPV